MLKPDGQQLVDKAQDTTLWVHIFVQMLAFGILFPLGMVLGVSCSLYRDTLFRTDDPVSR
jgi:hypothetical protein